MGSPSIQTSQDDTRNRHDENKRMQRYGAVLLEQR